MHSLSGMLRWALELLKTLLLKVLWYLKVNCHTNRCALARAQLPLAIPQVKGLPLVGTLFDLIAAGGATQLHKYIDARHQQYGPIFRERLGGSQDAIFVASASLMRSVFLHEGQHPRHPLPDAWTLYNKQHACQRGLFFMEGGEWLHNRRILNRLLLNGNLHWMDAHVDSITRQLVARWRAQAAAATVEAVELLQLEQQLYRWSIEVICGIMFGSSALGCQRIQAALDDFTQIVQKVFEHSSRLMNFPPRLAQLLRLRIWRDFECNVGEVLQQGGAIIELFVGQEHSMPLTEEQEGLFHKLQALEVPPEVIKRMFVDLVIAAGDTTAFSSQWGLYALAQQPQVQCRIAEELAVAPESPLVHGLVKETLRLYPVAPFIGRYLPQDAELGGHFIEKNTLVLLSLYTAGRDEAHFEQPLRLLPDRWCEGGSAQVLQPHGTLPFAIGQRSCIGRRVALKQLDSLLGACAAEFELRCLNEKPVDCVLRMVTVPDQVLRLSLKLRDK